MNKTTNPTAVNQAKRFHLWCDAEDAYEHFLARHEQREVIAMSDEQFEAWKTEYKRLYDDLFNAQLAYYRAERQS